jgi:predicted kinase
MNGIITKTPIYLKAKYIRREGSPGNYRYFYDEPKTKLNFNNKKEVINTFKNSVSESNKQKLQEYIKDWKSGNDTKGKHFNSETGKYKPSRFELHKKITKKYDRLARKAKPKNGKPKVIFMSGLPGSGKSFAIQKDFKEVAGNSLLLQDKNGERYVVLNADDLKANLPEYNGLNSMIVHSESSDLNSSLIRRYSNNNINIIIDGTFAKTEKASKQLKNFKQKGYDTSLIFIDAPVSQAVTMAAFRYKTEGRYVDYELINDYDSKINSSIDKLKDEFGSFTKINNSMPKDTLSKFANIARGEK